MMKTLTSEYGAVDIHIGYVTLMGTGEQRPTRYVVASGTYVAELPACGRDECAAGTVTPCVRKWDHARADNRENREHNQSHCHDWHIERVEAFARQVLDSHAPVRRRTRSSSAARLQWPLGAAVEFQRQVAPGESVTATGTVWSAGPLPRSVWLATQAGDAVLVQAGKYRPTEEVTRYPPRWQRDTIRRCDNLLRAGRVFALVDKQDGPDREWTWVSWHADPNCPSTAGKKPDTDLDGRPRTESAYWVIDQLLNPGRTYGSGRMCCTCIWLDPGAQIGAVA